MIGIIGEHGFVGSKLCQCLKANGINFIGVNRNNFSEYANYKNFSHVVNCAMPSGRFFAKNNPLKDFDETVRKTASIKYHFPEAKIIQISSISASVQLDTVYGKHKKIAENILDANDLILRLGPLYDKTLAKGALIDIIENKKVYVSGLSKYAFTPLEWVCDFIYKNLDLNGIIEIGASGYIELSDLANTLGSKSEFVGDIDDQIFSNTFQNQPNADDVISFCKKIMKNKTI
jgi:nucleoside-diphosphate-sugar epimerase